MTAESVRIYVPETRSAESAVRQALNQVVQGGATLYHGTGTWKNGQRVVSERVIVVEVLDCGEERRVAIERLATALLAAGEEAVLIATQHTTTRLSMRNDGTGNLGGDKYTGEQYAHSPNS
jgi:hypothetical protein